MSTKKSSKPKSANELRRKLDSLDRDLLKALNERTKLGHQLLLAKQEAGDSHFDQVDDLQTLQQIGEGNKGPLSPRTIRTIFRELISGARAMVHPPRAAYLGPKYSYSHIAALEQFGESAELLPVATIKAVFEELFRGQVEYGLVPIENSTDGRIVDTLDMFARMPTHICGEVQLRIHHNLLARCPRSEIQEVYSKPQAISQCRDWLAKYLPQARIVEMTSTAAAAQLAADKQGAAAIASLAAGASYGLQVVDANIEDQKHNVTRFAVIGGQPPKRTGRDKTAIMFELTHKPGSLADAMNVFKRAGLNLTWIESFPMPTGKQEYMFFVELEGHQSETRVKKALDQLKSRTAKMETLGSYPKSEPVE